MKKIILLSLFLVLPSWCAQSESAHTHVITDLDQFAKEWAHAAVTDLNRQELELMGTFLYHNLAASTCELNLRRGLLALQRISEAISFRIINRYQDQEAIAFFPTLASLIDKIEKEWAPSRNYYLTAWQMTDQHIEQSSFTTLKFACEQLQILGQRGLNNWANANEDKITEVVQKHMDQIDSSIQKFIFYKQNLESLMNHQNPQINESELKDIITVDAFLTLSTNVYETLHGIEATNDEITSISFNLISFNLMLYSSLYQALYVELENNNLLPMAILVDDKGYIEPDSRTKQLVPLDQFAC